MKKLLIATLSIGALTMGAAQAADMRAPAYKAPAPAPVVAYNWTGFYIGAGGGYGMWNQRAQFIDTVPEGLPWDNGGRGWFGTVQVGFDYQISSNIVIGAFADYDFSGIKGDLTFPLDETLGREKLKSSWAAGGRIGWLPFQQLLVFVSGGYTQARFDQVNFVAASTGTPAGYSLPKHTYSGWFIGSGYEYGIGWLPGFFWKTEYRFADYGTDNIRFIDTTTGTVLDESLDSRKYVHTVRSELVWRFNFGGQRY